MKKLKKIKIVIVAITMALFLAVLMFIKVNPDCVVTSFADKIMIEFEYEDSNNQPFVSEIESADAKKLKKIFNVKWALPDTPSCPCGGVNIIFQSKNKEIIVKPAGDGCPTVMFGEGKYFYLSERENREVGEILKKYGVVYPFGV